MYHNLNPAALGITGRQSELIELALTYGFGGLELDIAGIVKRREPMEVIRPAASWQVRGFMQVGLSCR